MRLRTLRKSPGFAIVAIFTLALGIGASTAIFSIIDNILMDPFPYRDAGRLVAIVIHDTERNQPGGRSGFNGPEFYAIAEQNHSFDGMIANDGLDILYTRKEGTDRYNGHKVTPGTFEFLGMPALLGRTMQAPDYEPGAPPVFVMRYKTWMNQFNADPNILNTTFVLNDVPRTLVGIMPPRFAWGDADMWIPAKPDRAVAKGEGGFPQYWFVMGHLKPGITEKDAQADFAVIANRLAKEYPDEYPKHFTVQIQSLTDLGGRAISNDVVHRNGSGGIVAADWLRERGEFVAGAGDRAREGVCDSRGAGCGTMAIGEAASGGKRDSGAGRGFVRDADGLGRIEGDCGGDAPGCDSGGGGDPAEWAGACVHPGDCGDDSDYFWAGSGLAGGAAGFE